MRVDTGQIKKTYTKTYATSTVYAAELQAFSLALAIAKVKVYAIAFLKLINIFAENQAAVRSLTGLEGISGAPVVKQITAKVE